MHNPRRWGVWDKLLRRDNKECAWPLHNHHLVIPHIKNPGEAFRLAQRVNTYIIHYTKSEMSEGVHNPCMNIVVRAG